jgi:predicted flap endonuclease-1-like 5' DNA nuclease
VFSKVARIVGFVGGVAAIVWAMRDRFISVAVSREPEPPTFRTIHKLPEELEGVVGIGPTYALRLRDAGYAKPADLIGAEPDRVAEIAGVSPSRATGWNAQVSPAT